MSPGKVSFICGCVATGCCVDLIQIWNGQQLCIEMMQKPWMPTYVSVPVLLTAFILAALINSEAERRLE